MNKHNDKPINLVTFDSAFDNRITPDKIKQVTWGELIEQYFKQHDIRSDKNGPTIIGASIKSPDDAVPLLDDEGKPVIDDDGNQILKRCGDNVDLYYFLMFDHDDGLTVEEAKELYKKWEHVGYTSHNHDPSRKDKFRVCVLLKDPAKPEDIRSRKDDILSLAKSADKSTLAIGRAFYLPSCSESNKDHAEIWVNHGELLDLNDFKVASATPAPAREHKPFNPAVKEAVLRKLCEIGRVEHDNYYKIAAATHNAGMTLHDFLYVASYLKPNKSQREHISQWNHSKSLDISPGYLINLLREHGVHVYTKDLRKADAIQKQVLEDHIDILQKRIGLAKYAEEHTGESEEELLIQLNTELKAKQRLLEGLATDDGDEFEARIYQMLAERQIYFVMDSEMLYEYIASEGQWLQYKVNSYIKGNPFLNVKGGQQVFMSVLEKMGRIHRTATLSAKNLPTYMLNLHRINHWLQPDDEDEHHEVFDILIRSLGDNKPENMMHLKQVIAWKYMNPSDYNLPCLVIFGQGGAGKNTLVEGVLGTIFGKHQVIAITQESLKNFNGQIAGKMAVLLNESVANKADMEQLKAMIGQESLYINPKYMKPYVAENVSLYFTGGNGAMGAIFLGRDQSDRRFSIMRVDRSIIDHVQEVKGLDRKEAIAWWVSNKHLLQDRKEVAKWLHHILTTIEDVEHTPAALHGQDYEELLDAQSGPFEWIIEQIFEHPDFKFISGPECFRLYELQCDEYGTRTRMNKTTFSAKLSEHLRRSLPHIAYKKCQKVLTVSTTPTTNSGWTNTQCKGAIDIRNISYITEHPRIKGKEVIAERFYNEPEKPDSEKSSLDDYAEVIED